MLPFFKQVERDLDFENDHHGSTGRIPVRRIFPEQWCGHTLAYGQAFEEAGYKYLADQNPSF